MTCDDLPIGSLEGLDVLAVSVVVVRKNVSPTADL